MNGRVACFATQGPGSFDEERIVALLADAAPEVWRFDRSRRARGAWRLLRHGLRSRPDLVVMEGTGIGGGVAVMSLRLLAGVPFVVSSGDAVAPYMAARSRVGGLVGAVYERALCRLSAGFIGWTPYLAGRALTLGAPSAMTAAGWAPTAVQAGDRERVRDVLGIPQDAIVFGIAGSLGWTSRYGYCYGWELVRAIGQIERPDVHVLVVGDGSGRVRLEEVAAGSDRVHLPGRVSRSEVAAYLSAMDIASLPQSVDGVGSFRFSTKLCEYMAAERPVVTGRLPFAYDLDEGWLWRLPGTSPWDPRYIAALADLMQTISAADIRQRRLALPAAPALFDRATQQRRAGRFIDDRLSD